MADESKPSGEQKPLDDQAVDVIAAAMWLRQQLQTRAVMVIILPSFEKGAEVAAASYGEVEGWEVFAGNVAMLNALSKLHQHQSEVVARLARDTDGREFIECLTCHLRSYAPEDIRRRYCGSCHKFHEPAAEPPTYRLGWQATGPSDA